MRLSTTALLASLAVPPLGARHGPKVGRRRAGELDDEDRQPLIASSEQLHDGFTKREREAAQEYLAKRAAEQRSEPMWQSWMQ